MLYEVKEAQFFEVLTIVMGLFKYYVTLNLPLLDPPSLVTQRNTGLDPLCALRNDLHLPPFSTKVSLKKSVLN